MASFCYFENSDGEGDFYYAKAGTSAAQSPATHPEKWQRLDIPARFAEVVAKLAAVEVLRSEDELESLIVLQRQALQELAQLKVQAARERQRVTLPVRMRR